MEFINYKKDGQVAYIYLNRPKMNVFNHEMARSLSQAIKKYQNDGDLRVAIISSRCENFSAGFDINEISEMVNGKGFNWNKSALFGEVNMNPDRRIITKPLICALNGVVNGAGFWLALRCDIRLATSKTIFGLGEGLINFPVEFTGLMTRYMPRAIANEMLLTGVNIEAQRLYEIGILNKIVSDSKLMEEAKSIASRICKLGPNSIMVMKQLMEYGDYMDYETLMAFTANLVVPVVNSKDTKEGIRAFIEKREPKWESK